MADFVLLDLAYAAGIIDGEGTIGITEVKVTPTTPRKRRSPQIRCYMSVAMTDPTIPIFLSELFGGTVHGYPPRKPGVKGVFQWSIGSKRAVAACEQLLPFLRLKQRQAQIVMDFYADKRFIFKQRQGIPEDELAARREYKERIQVLNKRGVG